MALVDKFTVDELENNLRWENTVDTPLLSVTVVPNSGKLIADVYTVTISGAGQADITTEAPNNPFATTIAGASFDGTTAYEIVIPGLSIIFDASAGVGDVAVIEVGQYLGTISAEGMGPGLPTDAVEHHVYNDSTSTVTNAKARVLTQAIHVKKAGFTNFVFSKVGSFAEWATEKTAGGGSNQVVPYELSISNVAGSGASKTCDLAVDGVAFGAGTIRDRTTGNLVSGVGLKAIDDYSYYVVSGPLQGLSFNIHPSCTNGSEANVLIFLNRYLQIAPDISGTPGAFGTDDVDLGTIGAGAYAVYWSRILVPGDGNNESNPYPCNVALSGMEMGAAEWS